MNRLEALNKMLEASKAGLLGAMTDPGDDGDDGCVYWNPEENRNCAIGCLLPVEVLQQLIDDSYNDNTSVNGLPDYALNLIPFTVREGNELQDLHDSCYRNGDPERFQRKIERLIENYDPMKDLDL